MKKITVTMLAALSAFAFSAPATAVPLFTPTAPVVKGASDIVEVQHRRHHRRPHHDRFERRGGHVYWRGHRGYTHPRPGYRRHGDFWFPAAAFALGAIVGGAIAAQPPVSHALPRSHVEWCYARYRSYRASDNTFQPYNGPRRQCVSPYY